MTKYSSISPCRCCSMLDSMQMPTFCFIIALKGSLSVALKYNKIKWCMHLLKKICHYTIKHNNNLKIRHFSAGHIRVYSNRIHKSKFIIKFKLAWERDECWENFWRIQSKFRWISFEIKEFLTCLPVQGVRETFENDKQMWN